MRGEKLRAFGESVTNAVLERVGRGVSRVQEQTPLPYDVLESDDAYLVVFDAPGATKSDVQVRYLDNEVQVRIDRFRDFHEGFEMRFPGRGLALDGRAKLPPDAGIDLDDSTATLTKNGTLQVRIPKDTRGTDVPVDEEDEPGDEATSGDDSGSVDEGADDDA